MKKIRTILSKKCVCFLIAFALMFVSLIGLKDLISSSGDADETWNVIKTFFSDNKYVSYVMYKGFYSFFPGALSYKLSLLFNVNEFFFMKVYHCLGFAYITTVGVPYMMKYLLNKEIKGLYIYLFMLVFFIFEGVNFTYISIDFASVSLFLMLINAIIKLKNAPIYNKFHLLYIGAILGISLSFSGQYSISIYILLLYLFYILFSKLKVKYKGKQNTKKFVINSLIVLLLLGSGYSITTVPDKLYLNNVVTPARKSGIWLPKGSDWVYSGMTTNMMFINYPASIPDNIGIAILKQKNVNLDIANSGSPVFNYRQYIRLILEYPVEFTVRWSERLFLGVINDYNNNFGNFVIKLNSFLSLFLMSSFLYISFLQIKNRVKKVSAIFNLRSAIIFSTIFSALVPCFLHAENRYYMAIRILIVGASIYSIKKLDFKKIKNISFLKFKNTEINYNVIGYFIFLALCILLYTALYQSIGPVPIILYNK